MSNPVPLIVLGLVLSSAGAPAARTVGRHEPQHGAQATDTLRGIVRNTDGRPLKDVRVAVDDVSRSAYTDEAGRFVLGPLPPGRHVLVVTRSSYASAVREVDLPHPGELSVVLNAEPLGVEGVTVTATRRAIDPAASPLPATALGPEQLRREHGVSLSHVLEDVSGVHTLSTGGQVGKPVIRGATGSRVLVLENGMPLEDYSWSSEDGPSVDARLADRVEVIRGPASVLYGSNAVGGVVNAVPEPIPMSGLGGSFTRYGGELYFASNNREAGTVFRAEGAGGSLGWRATVIGRLGQDLRTPRGELENTGFVALNGEAGGSYRAGWGTLTLRYSRYGGEFKLLEAEGPGVGPGGEAEEEGPERKLADDRVQLEAQIPVSAGRLDAKLQWQRHWLQELADEPIPGGSGDPGPVTEIPVFDLVLNTITGETLLHHSLGEKIRGTVGASGTFQDNASSGEVPLIPSARTSGGSLFAMEQLGLGVVELLAGARLDVERLDAASDPQLGLQAADRSYDVLTWSVGSVLHAAPGVRLSANLGRAWRAPTLTELFSNGPRLGEARFDVGDPDLTPETGISLDGGIEARTGPVRAELRAFRTWYSDYIFTERTDETRQGLRVYRHDQGDATLWGGEATLEIRPADFLALRARGDMVRGTNEDRDEPLPLMPPPRLDLEGEIRFGPGPRSGYARLEWELVAEQERLAPSDVPVGSHDLVHVAGGFATEWGGLPMRVDVRVRNLFDTAYRSFLSRYKEFALNAGRDVVVRVSTDL